MKNIKLILAIVASLLTVNIDARKLTICNPTDYHLIMRDTSMAKLASISPNGTSTINISNNRVNLVAQEQIGKDKFSNLGYGISIGAGSQNLQISCDEFKAESAADGLISIRPIVY